MADKQPKKGSEDVPHLSFRDFLDPWNKWVVVPNGSWRGWFDWLRQVLQHCIHFCFCSPRVHYYHTICSYTSSILGPDTGSYQRNYKLDHGHQ
eukprot:15354275-Ditylum_brightwellii.AAC.1